jgi:hypothetical protein
MLVAVARLDVMSSNVNEVPLLGPTETVAESTTLSVGAGVPVGLQLVVVFQLAPVFVLGPAKADGVTSQTAVATARATRDRIIKLRGEWDYTSPVATHTRVVADWRLTAIQVNRVIVAYSESCSRPMFG